MVQPIVIAGPTASGKSTLALKLAREHNGEIICADSRQFFIGMRVGVCGPSDEEMEQIKHHLYHQFSPHHKMDVGQFISLADQAILDIQKREKTPILVGGSGLYLRAFRYGMQDVPASDLNIKKTLQEAYEKDPKALFLELKEKDPESACVISQNDPVRIIRALEILQITGKKPSDLRKSHQHTTPRVEARWLLLWPEKSVHEQVIEIRVKAMFQAGLLEETKALINTLGKDHPLLSTMGYAQAKKVILHETSLQEAMKEVTLRHKQYAKRQKTWFQKESWWEKVSV